MTRVRTVVSVLMLMLAVWAMPVAAQIPAPLSDTVSDYADALDPAAEARITAALRSGRAETGVHVAVAVIGSRGDYGPPGAIEDFGKAWFNAWGIGDATRNDGILILVAIRDREMRIALGAGYPVVYDGRAQRVIDTALLPDFRNDKYAEGIEAGVVAAYELLAKPFVAGQPVTVDEGFPSQSDPTLWLFLSFFAAISAWANRRLLGDWAVRLRACPACGKRGLHRHRETLTAPGETTRGEQAVHTTCRSCGNDRVRLMPIPSRSESRKSGGSSGFGGGRSSGGGASGRW